MGWVIRDPRIIRWGGRGGFLDPRGSVIRRPPTTPWGFCAVRKVKLAGIYKWLRCALAFWPTFFFTVAPVFAQDRGSVKRQPPCLISVARARGYRQISVAYARDTAATDICRYPGHMPRISADIPGICHGYLLVFKSKFSWYITAKTRNLKGLKKPPRFLHVTKSLRSSRCLTRKFVRSQKRSLALS